MPSSTLPGTLADIIPTLSEVFQGATVGSVAIRTVVEIRAEFPALPNETPKAERKRVAEDLWARARAVIDTFPTRNITFCLVRSAPKAGEPSESSFDSRPVPFVKIVQGTTEPPAPSSTRV